jgi:NAD(P)-dependent dehydrogenase (short-subunit alcohol dehydrogenase family)
MELARCSALVTGAAGGLGAPTAHRLVQAGLRVVVFDRDAERAEAVADELGAAALAASGDVTNDDDVAGAIDMARSLAPLAVLVNVAGGGVGGGRTVRRDGTPHDKRTFAATMDLNALGTFNVSRLVAVAMADNEPDADGQRGVIVNTASIAGMGALGGQVAYSAAKAAIIGMTLPMAFDLAPMGIRVCCISPGTMGTPPMLGAIRKAGRDPADGMVFPARPGRPEEFAALVESIVANPYLNGENIRLDGAVRFVSR